MLRVPLSLRLPKPLYQRLAKFSENGGGLSFAVEQVLAVYLDEGFQSVCGQDCRDPVEVLRILREMFVNSDKEWFDGVKAKAERFLRESHGR